MSALTNADLVLLRRALNMYIQHFRTQLLVHTYEHDQVIDKGNIQAAEDLSNKLFNLNQKGI